MSIPPYLIIHEKLPRIVRNDRIDNGIILSFSLKDQIINIKSMMGVKIVPITDKYST
jgi:hypothetical protein